MSIALGCIADDFTGACDLAGMLARSGVQVNLHFDLPETTTPQEGIHVIALKCRTLPADEALRLVDQALDWLQAQNVEHLYWKYCSTFDSTKRGNIGPIAERMLRASECTQAIYCPAFPENGRSVYMGHLFVNDQLLSESSMRHHPLTPMRDSDLARLLDPQTEAEVGKILLAQLRAPEGPELDPLVTHYVADAVENEDLDRLASWGLGRVLLTGGSALARAIPELLSASGSLELKSGSEIPQVNMNSILMLAGSCSAATQTQVSHAQKRFPAYRLDPLRLAEKGREHKDWFEQQESGRALIYATDAPEAVAEIQERLGVERAGALVEESLAELARQAFDSGTRVFIVAGGESSGAVCRGLGIKSVRVGTEIAPGVPWCFAQVEEQWVAIALKSGNFGGPEFFNDAIEVLSAGAV